MDPKVHVPLSRVQTNNNKNTIIASHLTSALKIKFDDMMMMIVWDVFSLYSSVLSLSFCSSSGSLVVESSKKGNNNEM